MNRFKIEQRQLVKDNNAERAARRYCPASAYRADGEQRDQGGSPVFDVLVAMGTGKAPRWVALLGARDLGEAEHIALGQFGKARLLELRQHGPMEGRQDDRG